MSNQLDYSKPLYNSLTLKKELKSSSDLKNKLEGLYRLIAKEDSDGSETEVKARLKQEVIQK